jgi:hypothetical protein
VLEVRAQNLVELIEWVRTLEHLFVIFDSSSSNSKPVISSYLGVFGHGLSAEKAKGHCEVGVFSFRSKDVIRSSYEAVEVG